MCVLHAARDNRCAYNIVVVLTIPLQLPWCCLYITIPTPLCCAHVIVLPNRCASYHAHYSNVRPVFPVHILYFLQCLVYFGIILVTESFVAFSTIIAWSYQAWQQTLCVSYYNIIYVLFLPLFTQQKHRVSASSRSKLAKIVATLRCFYHISRVLQPKNYTAQKIHRFLRCICVIPTFSHFCMSTRWERLSRALRPLFLALAVLSACCIDRNNVARLNEGWHLHYQARLQRRIFEYTAGCITFYNIFGVGDLKVEILG